jgi:lipid II:glycine glycyltransferase (peptidoglycan interpeptide bridge formation enzyme)
MLVSRAEWDETLTSFPDAHLLQTGEWGEVKSYFGWSVMRIRNSSAAAQLLFRRLPLGLSIAYLPRGPLGNPNLDFWQEVDAVCRQQKAILLKVEPDAWDDGPAGNPSLLHPDGVASSTIQPRQTIVLDLTGGAEAVLARMKQKTRYNIHLAEKKGVVVDPWREFPDFGNMMDITAKRDGFGVHSPDYYRLAFEEYSQNDSCELFCARFNGQPLAAVMVFRHGKRAWYLYGASNNEERNRMPTYLVQWKAIQWAMEHGCQEYDLYGIPDASEEKLEESFTSRSDGLWGVYRFKRGFGGATKRSVGAVDKIYSPLLYSFYQLALRLRSRGGGIET